MKSSGEKKKNPPSKKKSLKLSFWVKYSLFAVNFLVWVGGICLLVIGVWSRLQKAELNSMEISLSTDPALFLVAVGVIMFITSIFGCIGSVKEHTLLLKVYCVVIVIVFILEIIACILAFVYIDRVEKHLLDYMSRSIKDYRDDRTLQVNLDYIQKRFRCCGSSSYADWELNEFYSCDSNSGLSCGVPVSCCQRRNTITCGRDTRRFGEKHASENIFTEGCIGTLMSLYIDNLIIIGFIAFAVGLLELVAVILAHILIKHIVISQLESTAKLNKKVPPPVYSQYPSTASTLSNTRL